MANTRVECFIDGDYLVAAGKITGMFKSARTPRADRWTGFFCLPFGADKNDSVLGNLRFMGHTPLVLRQGDEVEIYARARPDYKTGVKDGTSWDIVDVRQVRSTARIRAALRGDKNSVSADDARAASEFFGGCAVFAMAYLSLSGPSVSRFSASSGVGAAELALMRSNGEASMVSALLGAAFPSAVGTSVMSGLRQLQNKVLVEDNVDVQTFVDRVKAAPYALLDMAAEVGMSFRFETVDRIAMQDCGVSPTDERRLRVGVGISLRKLSESQGHVCWDVSDMACVTRLAAETAMLLKLPAFSAQALYSVVVSNPASFRISEYAGRRYLYSSAAFAAERTAAAALAEAIALPSLFADVLLDKSAKPRINALVCEYYALFVGKDAPAEAYAFVHRAIAHRVSVLTGGPGSGKTTAVKCLMYVLYSLLAESDARRGLVLTAPTGMASKRLTDSVNSATFLSEPLGADTAAKWVCRLRNASRFASETGDESMKEKYRERLKDRVLVVDEVSMMDLQWSCEFFKYLLSEYRCQVIFIGDRDQLPSVGYGEVFEHLCMLEPEVPITTLVGSNRVAKNKHVLLENFDRFKAGHTMSSMDWSDPTLFDRFWSDDDSASAARVVDEYVRFLNNGGSVDEVQVLTPVHSGELGTFSLNRAIQDVVNPSTGNVAAGFTTTKGDEIPGAVFGDKSLKTSFRVGDRVVLTKNMEDMMNGERGVIARYDSRWSSELHVEIGVVYVLFPDVDAKTPVEFPVDVFAQSFLPAYATTIHKSQGMEYEFVILACPHAFARPGFGVRNLPFTAVTRAKSRVFFAGREHALDAAILRKRDLRCSLMAQRVRGLVREV